MSHFIFWGTCKKNERHQTLGKLPSKKNPVKYPTLFVWSAPALVIEAVILFERYESSLRLDGERPNEKKALKI
jgi:hypothetical protein